MRDGEVDEERGAVAVADGADVGLHVASEFGGDEEAEAGGVGTEGDVGWGFELIFGEFLVDVGGEGGAEVADFEADVVIFVFYGEEGGSVLVGVFEGVGAEVVDDGVEEVVVGDGEFLFVAVRDLEGFLLKAEEVFEFGGDFVTEAADCYRFHVEEAVFEAGDFGEVANLF